MEAHFSEGEKNSGGWRSESRRVRGGDFTREWGTQKKAIGSAIPLQRTLVLPAYPSRGSDRRNLQGVPEGIVPPAFVGARDASREVTRYSMPTDQFGGKRSNLSRLENPIDI